MKNIAFCSLLLVLTMLMTAGSGLAQEEDGKLDLNTATLEQLVQIPGVKPEMAQRILEKRKVNGEFVDMDELLDVEGVDDNFLRQLKERVYVKPAAKCNC